ncbi:MAG TPA: outer membrane lipoprotein LolB [Thiotrichaceae bacterium]|nr:outer membrane lipoprotein LolB [Thiotrichaceae bacterium]HIM09048.1 outer membrane lipoprotein LolB [Gammaproteobacteria bacterium]
MKRILGTSKKALFSRFFGFLRRSTSCIHAVVRAVLPCTHKKITFFRGAQLPLLLAVSLLNGCAQAPKVDASIKSKLWLEHQITVSAIQSWDIKGRVAVKNDKESGTVTLLWNQFLSNYELRFIAPLGQGTYILSGTPSGVVMKLPKDKVMVAETAEQILRDGLGWDIHLDGLRYWVRGLPEPDIQYSELMLDNKGRLANMDQSGFNISVSRYSEQDGVSLPSKLTIKSDKIQLKVIIQNWKF